MPPVVRLVGDLTPVPDEDDEQVRNRMKEKGHTIDGGKLYWLEVRILLSDVKDKKSVSTKS